MISIFFFFQFLSSFVGETKAQSDENVSNLPSHYLNSYLNVLKKNHDQLLQRLNDKLETLDIDNVQTLITLINERLNEDVLIIIKSNDNVNDSSSSSSSIRIDYNNLEKAILQNTRQILIKLFAQQNPFLAIIIENNIRNEIKTHEVELKQLIGKIRIPVTIVDGILTRIHQQRRLIRRNIVASSSSSTTIDSILNPIFELIVGLFRQQISAVIKPLRNNINTTLTAIHDRILQYSIDIEQTHSQLQSVIGVTVDVLIKRFAEIVDVLRLASNEVLSTFIVVNDGKISIEKRKTNSNSSSTSTLNVREIITSIRSILCEFLTPLHTFLISIVSRFVILPQFIKNTIVWFIDSLVIPCGGAAAAATATPLLIDTGI